MLNNEARMKLEDEVCRKTGLDIPDVDWMTNEQLEQMLEPDPTVTRLPKKPGRRHKVKTVYQLIEPETIAQAFAVADDVLHRRKMYAADDGVIHEVLIRCDSKRVTFRGVTHSNELLTHYLQTGVWLPRLPREKKYRAQVRHEGRVKSLGYFASKEEAEAAKLFFKESANNA